MSTRRDILAMAGKKTRAEMAEVDRPAARENLPEFVELEPLKGVQFATPLARERAIDVDLSWRDFAASSRTPSSRNGYTTKDVREIAKEAAE